ncbi:MAG: hypothetical protein HKL90_00030 [Elusimicrobia bacterium]|nr:hypothetical protein [Elusimicrobiota bacterium]
MLRFWAALLLAAAPATAADVLIAPSRLEVPAASAALAAPLTAPVAVPGLGTAILASPALSFSAAAPAFALPALAAPAAEPVRPAQAEEPAAVPAGPGRVRALLARLRDPFGSKTSVAPPPVDEPQRLDREFSKIDFWTRVGPAARAEIEGLRARRRSKAELKNYVRRQAAEAFARIKAARGTQNIGLHYNLHGGIRQSYVGAGIRASKGDIALRYTTSGDWNDKVYFFQTDVHHPYDALDASNGEILFWPTRMGSALSVFALDAPELRAARADGRIADVGSISMNFHKGMRGVPYSTFLAPPLTVFVGTAKKLGLRRLSRDEETLATIRYLEAALSAGGGYVTR